jgi:hypothetical protein
MDNQNHIQSVCVIQNNEIIVNSETIFKTEPSDFAEFSKKAYQKFEMNYPKFFKMDNLSKLAFMGADLVISQVFDISNTNNIALLFANRSSSLDTDVKYQKSISNSETYFPSPAVFVYTLPNICLGEISIRHQLKSENSFFIFEAFNPEFMIGYANVLIDTGKADHVLCGWTEYFNEEYKAFLYLVSKEGKMKHDKKTLVTEFNK